MCRITIKTTTYNREHLLPKTVNSVLTQTFTDFEYLIVNNGSTDNTQKIIEQYCEQDKRIRTISNPYNIRSRNDNTVEYFAEQDKILSDLSVPYYMQIDDDDFLEPNTAETLYNLITQYDADMASVGSKYVYPDGTIKDKFVFEGIFVYSRIEAMMEMLKRKKFNSAVGGKIFRKEMLKIEYPGVEECRDIFTSYRKMNNINKMVVTGTPLYYFYRHDNNASGLDKAEQITPARMRQHLEANVMRTEWLTKHMPEIKEFVFYSELSFMLSLYERIHRLNVESCFEIAQEMKGTVLQHNTFLVDCGFCTQRELEILKSL
jgi:glycosyltransferase involved in cell wall biosynthesis